MIEAQSDKEATKASEQKLSNNKNTENQQFNFKSIKNAERPSIIHVILLNRTLRILCLLGIFCTLIPIADYFYFYSSQIVEHQTDDSGSSICSHYPIYQIPCGVENISRNGCIQLDCCHSSKTGCYHFLPSKYQYRVNSNQPWSSSQYLSPTKMLSPLSTTAASRIKLDIQEITEDILSLALWNSDKFSSSSPSLATTTLGISSSIENEKNFQYRVFSPEMFVEVKRRSSGKILLSTSRGALIMSDGYFEWSFYLGSNMTLMGFGELELNPGQILLINNDVSSVLPFVVAFDEEDKQYHAVYFQSLHSPTEVEILKSNVIVVRQFYSSSFELKLFIGPSYDDIIYKQLAQHLAHYRAKGIWTLGIHVCHSKSASSSTFLNITEAKIELDHLLSDENVKSIPFDSHCLTSEMTSNVISSKSHWQTAIESFGVVEFIERLQANGKKLLFHVNLSMVEVATAAASVVAANDNDDDETARKNHEEFYQRAIDGKLFLQDRDGANFVGISEKTKKVFYLDYITKSQEIADLLTSRWRALSNFLNFTDGIFITKSSPQDDTTNKSFTYLEDEFQFKPKNFEHYVTNLVPLNLKTSSSSLLYDEMLIHQLNNFGRSQTRIFHQLNKDEGKFCITDSYREDTECAVLIKEPNPGWITFKSIVYKSVWHSMIGIPIYGCEVCGGSDGNIQEDLCIRWYQFAIFSPLFYVKSDRIPLKFSKYSERIMSRAIQTRYTLLSYIRMNILERKALLKPLRLAYPQLDDHVIGLTKHQFIFGDSLMIAPVVEPLIRHLDLYFPSKYFEFWSGLEMPQNTTHFSVVMHDIPIFVRAGHIVALNLAYESLSAEDAIQQPFLLIVAFECNEKFSCHSQGRLLVDDGDDAGEGSVEFNFVASENHLNITVITRPSGGTRKRNPNEASRNAICDPERRSTTGEFLLAKIYGLGEFKAKYRNDYLSLDLNICTEQVESEDEDATDWNKTFSFLI